MATAALGLIALLALAGALLQYLAKRWPEDEDALVAQLNAVLPQTQCAQCGYPGCRPYAEALAAGTTEVNLCPPGGEQGMQQLAALLGTAPKALAQPAETGAIADVVAVIVEADCIGCTLCIQACPVDAIVGAAKYMHTVLEAECTGCELCLPPCPVDCIELLPRIADANANANANANAD